MKTIKIKSEQIVLGVKESSVIDPSLVVEIQKDIVKQYVKDNDGLYQLVISPEMEMIPFEVRSAEPVESIDMKIHIHVKSDNLVEYETSINWFDILMENNKSYIHRSCLIPSTMTGELLISPLSVLKICLKDGQILEKDSDSDMIITY